MNRKNVIEWVFFFIMVTAVLTIAIIQEEQKNRLEETLIEKENVISDMETHVLQQQKVLDETKSELEAVGLQYAEVLGSLEKTNQKVESLAKKNEALHSQNETLTKKVSALQDEVKKEKTKKIAPVAKATKATATKVSAPSKPIVVSRNNNSSSVAKEFYVEATAYTAYCSGCSGTTATGINLRANPDLKVIAVDPRVIPLGSKVWVEGYGNAVAADTGGAIKGNKVDLFMKNKSDAYKWGRKKVRIKVLDS